MAGPSLTTIRRECHRRIFLFNFIFVWVWMRGENRRSFCGNVSRRAHEIYEKPPAVQFPFFFFFFHRSSFSSIFIFYYSPYRTSNVFPSNFTRVHLEKKNMKNWTLSFFFVLVSFAMPEFPNSTFVDCACVFRFFWWNAWKNSQFVIVRFIFPVIF